MKSLNDMNIEGAVSENELEQVSGGTAMTILMCEKCKQFITVCIDSSEIDKEKGHLAKCPHCKEERKFTPSVFFSGFSPAL